MKRNDPFEPETRIAPYIKEGIISKEIVVYEVMFYKGEERIKIFEGPREEAIKVEQYYSKMMEELNPKQSYRIVCDAVKLKVTEIDRAGMSYTEHHIGENR